MKTKNSNSIRAYGCENPDIYKEPETSVWAKLPSDIVQELEEFKKGLPNKVNPFFETLAREYQRLTNIQDRSDIRFKLKSALILEFGKYPQQWMKEMWNQELSEIPSDQWLSALPSLIADTRSRMKWQTEQDAAGFSNPHPSLKEKTPDGFMWGEKPPRTKRKSHEPAAYSIRLPDGRYASTAKAEGEYKVRLHTNPPAALRDLANRLGVEPVGGDVTILRSLLGEGYEEYVPAYESIWAQGRWNVRVAWMKPNSTHTQLWEDHNGELTRIPQFNQEPLTISDLTYKVLSESNVVEYQDENGFTGYIQEEMPDNEMEHCVSLGAARDRESEAINIDKLFAEDDVERKLLNFLSSRLEESFITMGDVTSKQAWNALYGEQRPVWVTDPETGLARKELRWEGGINGAQQYLAELLKKDPIDQEKVESLKSYIAFLEEIIESWELIYHGCYTLNKAPELWSWNMRGTNNHPPMMEPVKEIPNSHTVGKYTPPAPKVIEVDTMPTPACNMKAATVTIEPSHLNLPAKLRKTLRGNWQQHLRNIAASNAFASALGLVEALRA